MSILKSVRIALLFAGTGAMSVSSAHPAATTPTTAPANAPTKHQKSSTAKLSSGSKANSPATAKSPTTAKAGAAKSGAVKTPATKSTSSKAVGKSGKRSTKKAVGRQRGQTAPTPERISEIQQALAKNGAFSGQPSGKWDDSTADAMRRFQAARGLNPTGKLDALTLNQLGLGSATAGVAPPTPMVRTLSSSSAPSDIQQ